MIGALFRRNLRHAARVLAVLMLGLAAFEVLLALGVVRLEQSADVRALVERLMPPVVRQLVGEPLALLSFGGGLAFGFAHPVVLIACGAFVVAAATIPAAERETGLLDLILARPVARPAYLAAVLGLVAVGAVLMPAALVAGAALGTALADPAAPLPASRYVPAAAQFAVLLLGMGGLTLAFASGARRRGPAVARSVGVLVASLMLEVLGDFWPPLATIQWLSPFHYYAPIPAVTERATSPLGVAVLAAFAAASVAVAFARFSKTDV